MRTNLLRIVYVITAVAIVASIGVVLAVHHPQQACRPVVASSGAHGAPGVVRFTDTRQHTSFVLQTDPHAKDHNDFTYITSDAAQYQAGPATQAQATTALGDPLHCAGLEAVYFDGAAQLQVAQANGATGPTSKVQVHLVAVLDLVHLGASITFDDLTNKRAFVTSVQPPPDMHAAVTSYNQATISQHWNQLYTMTSQQDTAGYTQAQFAQAMAQQVSQVGTVTAVTLVSGPVIGTNPAGITYFTVTETFTLSHAGKTSTQTMTSVYVLEDGVWKFWFSAPQ